MRCVSMVSLPYMVIFFVRFLESPTKTRLGSIYSLLRRSHTFTLGRSHVIARCERDGNRQSRHENDAIYVNKSLWYFGSLFLAVWSIYFSLIQTMNTQVWRRSHQLHFIRYMYGAIPNRFHAISSQKRHENGPEPTRPKAYMPWGTVRPNAFMGVVGVRPNASRRQRVNQFPAH